MTWERFGYICRKAASAQDDSQTVSARIENVEQESAGALYGKTIGLNQWPKKILDQLKLIENQPQANDALALYAGLLLTKHFEVPMTFKRVIAYLSYVIAIFLCVVGVYQFKVAPVFAATFETFGAQMPSNVQFYQANWGYFVVLVLALLLGALLAGLQLKRLFQFNVGAETRMLTRLLVLKPIRQSYARVTTILQYPMLQHSLLQHSQPVSVDTQLVEHLHHVNNSALSVATEMQVLIDVQMRDLLEKAEQQMKLITTVVAVVVVTVIFMFMASVYSPIFMLGESI